MRSKGNAPTAAQKRWQELVAHMGCIVTRAHPSHCQLHHVAGATYKQNRILIGPWFILPLCRELHDVGSNNPLNVTHHRRAFTEQHGTQKSLFFNVVHTALLTGEDIPFSMEVLNAIKDTRY